MAQTQANLDAEINTLLISGSDITAATLRQVLHDMNAALFQSGVGGFAAPANLVSLTSNPGSSPNAIRSDATLALSTAIAPVWTSQHSFNSGIPSTNPTTGALLVSSPGGMGCGGSIFVGSAISAGAGLSCNGTVTGTPVPVEVAQRVTGTCSGTVSTTDIAVSVISGATITGINVYTTTGFGASGSVNLTAGTGIGDNAYVAAQNIKSLGLVVITFNASGSPQNLFSMPAPPNFFVRLTQTGTPSAIGSALILVKYAVLP